MDDYVRFLKLVQHYKKEIKQWEIWNEPNIFFWQGPKDLYAPWVGMGLSFVRLGTWNCDWGLKLSLAFSKRYKSHWVVIAQTRDALQRVLKLS
jgi:hypothetical protein